MQMKSVKKTQFTGLNDRRFYFHNGIVLLPFQHALLKILRKEKEKCRSNIHNKIQKKMFEFLSEESKAVRNCERLRILRSIYSQALLLYLSDSEVLMKIRDFKSKREQILNVRWK